MKGIPSLSQRYAAAMEKTQVYKRNLDTVKEKVDKAMEEVETYSRLYNEAVNDLQTLLLLKDIQDGNVTVSNAHTGKRINVTFI